MRLTEIKLYKFSELSESSKQRARDNYRRFGPADDWDDYILQDAQDFARCLGITIDERPFKTYGGQTRYEPKIWFSGFSSQGDGACFEGSYRYAKRSQRQIRNRVQDATLLEIAESLQDIQKRHRYLATATVGHAGHYYHSRCTDITVEFPRDLDWTSTDQEDAEKLRKQLRRFMDWIYQQLKTEYEYRTSDEYIGEELEANESEFYASGELFNRQLEEVACQ